MKHLAEYIQESISQGIDESIFSQTGIGDKEAVSRKLPLYIIRAVTEYFKKHPAMLTDTAIRFMKTDHVYIELSVFLDENDRNAERKLFNGIKIFIHNSSKIAFDFIEPSLSLRIICPKDSGSVEHIGLHIYDKSIAASGPGLCLQINIRKQFFKENENEIREMLVGMKNDKWDGKIKEED